MPVSRITTVWPLPPNPAAQVTSEPMCAPALAICVTDRESSWMEVTRGDAANAARASASTFMAT